VDRIRSILPTFGSLDSCCSASKTARRKAVTPKKIVLPKTTAEDEDAEYDCLLRGGGFRWGSRIGRGEVREYETEGTGH
jgi:hypothetical protein